jgi:hypothetical protein
MSQSTMSLIVERCVNPRDDTRADTTADTIGIDSGIGSGIVSGCSFFLGKRALFN